MERRRVQVRRQKKAPLAGLSYEKLGVSDLLLCDPVVGSLLGVPGRIRVLVFEIVFEFVRRIAVVDLILTTLKIGIADEGILVQRRLFKHPTRIEQTGPGIDQVQAAQAAEIMTELAGESLPVIVVGDLNSNADGTSTPTYADFLDAGYSDAWAQAGTGDGLTCCHEDDLRNPTATLVKRIDYVLYRGGLEVVSAAVVGADPAEMTLSGLWASDHAGVVATLRFQ